jgi:hypothetical protein
MSVCVIQFGAGRAGLQASVRGGDEAGHHIFVVYLKNQLPLYGEWRSKWTDGGYDFDVETVNFGYVNKENVGNRHADARCKLSFEERQITEQLVRSIFSTPEAVDGTAPFSTKGAKFLGHVYFIPGWIAEA